VNYIANWIALPILVEFGNIRPDVAQVGFNLIVMLAGYFWHSRVTFGREA
jgi:putative flippase GtrA